MVFSHPDFTRVENETEELPDCIAFLDFTRTTADFTVGGPGQLVRVTHNLPSAFITNIPTTQIMMKTVLTVSLNPNTISLNPNAPHDKNWFIKIITSISGKVYEHRIRIDFMPRNIWRYFPRCAECETFFVESGFRFCYHQNVPQFGLCKNCYFSNIKLGKKYEDVKSFDRALRDGYRITPLTETTVSCVMDKNHEADCFCLQCDQDYCFNCFLDCHTGRMKSHQMINQCEKPWAPPKCVVHEDKDATMFCINKNCIHYMNFVCHLCWTTTHRCKGLPAAEVVEERTTEMKEVLWRLLDVRQEARSTRYIVSQLEETNREEALKHLASYPTPVKSFCHKYGKYHTSRLPELADVTDEKLKKLKTIAALTRVVKQRKDVCEGLRLLPHAMQMVDLMSEKVDVAQSLPMDNPDDTCEGTSGQRLQRKSRSEERKNRKLEKRRTTGKCGKQH